MPPWKNPRWNSLRGPDKDALRAVFQDLEQWLKNPSFETVALPTTPGSTPTYDPVTDTVTPAPETTVDTTNIVPDDGEDPATPTGLSVLAGIGSLFFQWDANTEADMVNGWGNYEIQIDNDSDFSSTLVDQEVGLTGFAVTGLTTGTTYYARVRAVDAHGNTSPYSSSVNGAPVTITAPDLDTDIDVVPNDDGSPAVVSGLSVSAGFKSLWVNWTAGTEVDVENHWGYYQIQLATDAAFTSVIGDVTAKASFTAFTDLDTSNTYYVRVKTFDAHGNSSAWSSYVSGIPTEINNVDIGVGQITEDSIADFAVAAKKFNTASHVLY